MTDGSDQVREELERIRRVSDQLCTAHSILMQRFKSTSFLVDVTILLFSAWLAALALAEPRFLSALSPFGIDPKFWFGILAVFTFCLSLVELKYDGKKRAEGHSRSLSMYSEVKREAGYLLASTEEIPVREFQRLAARYDMASDVGVGIPDAQFLKLKRAHKTKVEISKLLDSRPSAPVILLRLELLCRDMFPKRKE